MSTPETSRGIPRYGKGDVLFWKEFEFPDKTGSKDSYIFLLTECIDNHFLVIRGTSNLQLYDTEWGRKRDILRITTNDCHFLLQETILDADFIRPVSAEKLEKALNIGRAQRIGKLGLQLTNRLVNFVLASKRVAGWKKKWIRESKISFV